MKQTEANPWDVVAEKYPPGTVITGKVRNLTNYGAFVEIEEGIDGLLHVSDLSWTERSAIPSEVLKKGDKITASCSPSIRSEARRPGPQADDEDPWDRASRPLPARHDRQGKVTKITNFGVFVELDPASKGCCTSPNSPTTKVENPRTWSRSATRWKSRSCRVDIDDRKIGLSRKRSTWTKEEEAQEEAAEGAAAAPRRELRGGTGSASGQLIQMPEATAEE